MKQKGDDLFRAKDYKKALGSYAKVFCYVTGLYPADDKEFYEKAPENRRTTTVQQETIKDLQYKTYLNMSQIDLFNKNYDRCIYRVNKAFEIKTSMKGYYRRGLAYFNLKNYFKAEKDFNKVIETNPEN